MAAFTIGKVNTLPATPAANKIYIYKDSNGKTGMYIADKTGGTLHQIGGSPPGLDDVLAISNETERDVFAQGFFVTDDNYNYSNYVDESGLFANGSGEIFVPISSGITTNASVVGLLETRNSNPYGISAAVVGMDHTTSGSSRSYGGYFNSIFTGELNVPVLYTEDTQVTMGSGDMFCSYNKLGGTGKTVYLPYSNGIKAGRMVLVKTVNDDVSIETQGSDYIINTIGTHVTSVTASKGDMWMFVWDGYFWQAGIMATR